MDIRPFEFAFIIIFGFLCSNYGRKGKTVYVWSVIVMLLLESGLRSVLVGNDTIFYFNTFNDMKLTSWSDTMRMFRDSYVQGTARDPGYYFLVKVLQIFINDFTTFLLVIGTIYFIPLGYIINKYTTRVLECVFAFALYVALFRIIALSGVRQQIALGLSFIAFAQILRGKNILALLFISIGFFIHSSCALCLAWYGLKLMPNKWINKVAIVSMLFIPFIYSMSGAIMMWFASFIKNDYYEAYGEGNMAGGANTYFMLMELLAIGCFFCLRKVTNNNTIHNFITNLPMTILLTPLIMLNGSMIRMGQYFTLYLMVILPMAVREQLPDKNMQNITFCSMIGILIFMALQSNIVYYFYWDVC